MNAVDTNILIYINNPRDPVKQGIAASLVSALTEGLLTRLKFPKPARHNTPVVANCRKHKSALPRLLAAAEGGTLSPYPKNSLYAGLLL